MVSATILLSWETALPKSKARFSTPDVHIGKGIVGVTWFKGSVAYPITGGEALWSKGAAQCSYEVRLGGGRELIASGRGCVQKHSRRAIWKVDPRTGEPEWTYKGAGR
ncbi:hypothetical protein ACIQNG_14555 [Streptomyces sp. NPDC091377]|uniref:hypothetical protein n=1 Tax=Streptomyces sp. NPDC091377 TaxID=3365995 RepID=UPI0037FABE7A